MLYSTKILLFSLMHYVIHPSARSYLLLLVFRSDARRLTYRCRFLTKNTRSVTWMTVHTICKLRMMFFPSLRRSSSMILSFAAHLFCSWSPIQRSRCAKGSGAHPYARTDSPSALRVCSTGRQHIVYNLLFSSRFGCRESCFVRLSMEQCVFVSVGCIIY